MNLRERTLQIAMSQLGVQEKGGDNRGPEVEEYLKAADLKAGQPWCAAFVNWCASEAANEQGVMSPLEFIPLEGLVASYVSHGRRWGWHIPASKVLPGDLFCIWNAKLDRYAHIGFVRHMKVESGWFETVEGNSNDEGSREGKEVCSNIRSVLARPVFLRWTKIVEKS